MRPGGGRERENGWSQSYLSRGSEDVEQTLISQSIHSWISLDIPVFGGPELERFCAARGIVVQFHWLAGCYSITSSWFFLALFLSLSSFSFFLYLYLMSGATTGSGVMEEANHTLCPAKPRLISASTALQCSQRKTAKEIQNPYYCLTATPLWTVQFAGPMSALNTSGDLILFCLQEHPGLAHPFLMISKPILRGDCPRPATIQQKTFRARGLSFLSRCLVQECILCASDSQCWAFYWVLCLIEEKTFFKHM